MDMPAKWRCCAVLLMILFPPTVTSNEAPDLSTLEFLFEWLDDEGEILDPRMFEEPSANDVAESEASDDEDE